MVIQVVHKVHKLLLLEKKLFFNLYKIQNNRLKTNNINVKYYYKFQLRLSLGTYEFKTTQKFNVKTKQ